MVRLITHNLLACNARTCSYPANFPLRFQDVKTIEVKSAEFNPDFLRRMLGKIDYAALVSASQSLGFENLPEELGSEDREDLSRLPQKTLEAIHHVLLEIHVQDGGMVCPSCGHLFPIKDGIPNMLLAEHELRR